MKKIISLICLFLLLTGCSINDNTKTTPTHNIANSMLNNEDVFIEIYRSNEFSVVYDVRTKVQYAVSTNYRSSGNFTVLVDENGNPLLWNPDNE